jgi:hypothetical protein
MRFIKDIETITLNIVIIVLERFIIKNKYFVLCLVIINKTSVIVKSNFNLIKLICSILILKLDNSFSLTK